MAQAAREETAEELKAANRALKQQLDETNKALWALYKELDDKNAALEQSNTELDQFAMIAGHDLQEPLRKIVAFGERLADECGAELDDRGRDYVARMQNSATRMTELITDLLRYARVTSQARPFEPTDLNVVVADAVSDLEDRITRENGRVVTGDLPTIEADPTQIRQLIQNLVGNGLKFHRPDIDPEVTITAETGAERTAILIADNGIGFDPKYAGRIFQPFRRLHGKAAFEGTGMGLAICQKIAKRHGGEIDVVSAVDHGSTFKVILPLEQPRPVDQDLPVD